jgi:uncharacterized protein (TIGR02145 family)
LSGTAAHTIQFRNGKISFALFENAPVAITIHDVGGRQVFGSKRTLGSGTHAIGVPIQSAGIFLCKVTLGNEAYSFRVSSLCASAAERTVVSSGASVLAKQAKAAAVIDDVIAATKTGWLNYRCVIGDSDTSGVVIKMIANAGDMTDVEGNEYQTVRIGNQVWMAENLRVTKYNDGSAIPLDTSSSTWSATTPKYCFYNNTTNADSIKKYGALYNWYVVSPANANKVAPAGWHVPSDAEWDTLQNYLITKGYNWDGTTTGNKIGKSLAAKTDWAPHGTPGGIGNDPASNNRTGFSGLPGNYRNLDGLFGGQSNSGSWWSATEDGASLAWYRYLDYMLSALSKYANGDKRYGFFVRLVRD